MTQQLRTLAQQAGFVDHNEKPSWYDEQGLLLDGVYYPKNARFIAACSPYVVIGLLDQIDALKAERDKLRTAAQAGRQAMIDHGCAYLGHLKQYTDATNQLIEALDIK